MRFAAIKLCVLLVLLSQLTWASKPSHRDIAYERFARLLDASTDDPISQGYALQFLGSIALNKPGDAEASAYAERVIRPVSFQTPFYKYTEVREEALYAIGRLGTVPALEFLEGIGLFQFEDEDREHLWSASQIALSNARQLRFVNLNERAGYLASLLRQSRNDLATARVRGWASEELCNLGALNFLPDVAALYKRRSSKDAAEYTKLCQDRMWVVASNSDRPSALASVLTVHNGATNPKLVWWAIRELRKYRTPASNARVDAYIEQLIALPRNSPFRQTVMETIILPELGMFKYLEVK